MNPHGPAISLIALSAAGFALAAYFALAYYGLVRTDSRWLPPFCRMGERTCGTVIHTRYGRLTGIPNSVLALPYYVLIAGVAASGMGTGIYMFLDVALGAGAATVLIAAYLIHALTVRLRTICVLCFISHAINGAILAILAAIRFGLLR
jgi:uncharacterized membrane protein